MVPQAALLAAPAELRRGKRPSVNRNAAAPSAALQHHRASGRPFSPCNRCRSWYVLIC